jgi:hypothetical protein
MVVNDVKPLKKTNTHTHAAARKKERETSASGQRRWWLLSAFRPGKREEEK